MKAPRLASGALGQPGQWNALHDDASGGAQIFAHQQLGAYSLGTNPSNGQLIDFIVNGTTITLTAVTSIGTTAGNFLIGSTAAATLQVALNLLQNPWTTNANQVALTLANQELLAYVGFALSGTTLTAYSLNTITQPPLTSYSGSTTFSSGSYTANTMRLYVEPGTYYIGTTQVKFLGGSTPTVTAPVSHPRIDVLTIDTSGTLAWITGTEASSPSVPTYIQGKVPICELMNVVGETALYDLANQQSGQGYIQADVRPFNSATPLGYSPQANNTGSVSSASTQTIAHTLGRAPVSLLFYASASGTTALVGTSLGTYNGTSYNALNPNFGPVGDLVFVESGGNAMACTVTWDATNFYLVWTVVSGSAFTVNYLWQIM